MVTWSPDDIDEGIQAILLQIYPVLLSTLLSIGRNQLSLFDANFALIITSSPLTVYLAVASICHWFRIEVGLYKRVRSYRLVTRALGALVLFLWFGLSAIARLSDRAFIDSGLCEGSTIEEWLWDFFWFATYSVGYPGFPSIPGSTTLLYIPIFILFWDLILEIKEGWSSFKRRSTLRKWFRIPWISVRWAWYVPAVVDPQLPKPYASQASYQPQPQMVYTLTACISRCRLGIQSHQQRHHCIKGICAVIWSGMATSFFC